MTDLLLKQPFGRADELAQPIGPRPVTDVFRFPPCATTRKGHLLTRSGEIRNRSHNGLLCRANDSSSDFSVQLPQKCRRASQTLRHTNMDLRGQQRKAKSARFHQIQMFIVKLATIYRLGKRTLIRRWERL